MDRIPTLSIGLAATGPDPLETRPVYPIEVTHLATRIVVPAASGALYGLSQGVKLLLPAQGTVDLTIDGEPFGLASGLVLVVDGNAQMTATRTAPDKTPEESLPQLRIIEFNALIGGAFPIRELLDLPLLMDAESADHLERLFEQLTFGETSIPRLPGGVDISRLLTAINLVATLLKAAGEDTVVQRKRSHDERVPRLRQFLLENMGRNVAVAEMARHLGMSRTACFRWAKLALGCSPLTLLRTMRLERCQEWIAQNAGSLDEIASQTGFSDCSHLGREFKKHFGMTPAQYRKTARSSHQADFLAQAAERYFSHGRFDEALAACEQCLKSNPPAPVLDRMRYQKGLCLRALGRRQEAIGEWQALRGTGFSHRAGMQECREAFNVGSTDRALDLLGRLYASANEFQKRDLIYIWLDQVRTLREARTPQPLRQYLALRKELFPRNMHSMGAAVNALRMLGENLEILEQCKELPIACYNALRQAGKYDAAMAKVAPNAIALLQGRYEDVLAMETKSPREAVEALVELGRAEEAIEQYPEHSAYAYLALGRYEELLERSPPLDDNDDSRMAALLALGRTQEVNDLLADSPRGWKWSLALLYLRPDAVLESNHPDAHRYRNDALALMAINALLADDRPLAEETLEQIDGIRSPDLWWYDHHGTELLIVALLRGMLGQPDHLRDDLKEMIASHKYKDKQALWHDAAYLSGTISTEEYRAQPQQRQVAQRLTFIRAAANDLKGRRSAARKGYEATLSPMRRMAPSELLRQRFATWRLQEL